MVSGRRRQSGCAVREGGGGRQITYDKKSKCLSTINQLFTVLTWGLPCSSRLIGWILRPVATDIDLSQRDITCFYHWHWPRLLRPRVPTIPLFIPMSRHTVSVYGNHAITHHVLTMFAVRPVFRPNMVATRLLLRWMSLVSRLRKLWECHCSTFTWQANRPDQTFESVYKCSTSPRLPSCLKITSKYHLF
jgi:hypothetical protein